MTATHERATQAIGPERPGGQGLDEHQYESGDHAIRVLLTDPIVGPQTDLVITCRDSAYEVWAQRGMVRFERRYSRSGGYEYRVIEQIGENPIDRQDPQALSTVDEELGRLPTFRVLAGRREYRVRRAGPSDVPAGVRAHLTSSSTVRTRRTSS